MRRLAQAAMLIAIGAVAGATNGEAAGSSTWTLQATPTPNVTTGGGLLVGVSCPSTTDCVAVGYDGNAPLSEMWNGAKWTVHPVSVPAYSLNTQLRGVSCPSTTMVGCTAVGASFSSAGNVALVERWSKGQWVIQPTPTGVTGGPAQSCSGSTASPHPTARLWGDRVPVTPLWNSGMESTGRS